MKLLLHHCCVIVIWIVVFVSSQRHFGNTNPRQVTARTNDPLPVKPLASRGKTRFSLTPEYQQTLGDNSALSTQTKEDSTRTVNRSSNRSNSPSRSRQPTERTKSTRNYNPTTNYNIPSRRTDETRDIQFITPTKKLPEQSLYEVKEVLDDIPNEYKEQYHYSKQNTALAAHNDALISAQRVYQQSYARKPNYQETNENILKAARIRSPSSRRRSKFTDTITNENRPQARIQQAIRVKPQASNIIEPRKNLRVNTNTEKLEVKNRVIEVTENEPDISYADYLLSSEQRNVVPKEGNYVPSGPGTLFSLEESIQKDDIHFRAGRKINRATEVSRGNNRNSLKINSQSTNENVEATSPKEWITQDLRTPKGRGNKKANSNIISDRKKSKSLDTDTINVVSIRGRERLAISDLPELISQMRYVNSVAKPRSNRRMDNFESVQFVDKDTEIDSSIMPLMNMDLQKSDVDTASSTRTETRVRGPSSKTTEKNSYTVHPRHTRSTTEVVENADNTPRRSRTRTSSRNSEEQQTSQPASRNSRQRQTSRRTSPDSEPKLEQIPSRDSSTRSSRTRASTNTRTSNQRNSRNFESSEVRDPANTRQTNSRGSKTSDTNETRRPTNSRRTSHRTSKNQDSNEANPSTNTRNVNRNSSRRFESSNTNTATNSRTIEPRVSNNYDVGKNEVSNSRTIQSQRGLRNHHESTTAKSIPSDESSNYPDNNSNLKKPQDQDIIISSTERMDKFVQVTESINGDRKTGKTEENTAVDKAPISEEIQPTKPLNSFEPSNEKTKPFIPENVDPSPLPIESPSKKSTKPLDLMEVQSSEKIKAESVNENAESSSQSQVNYRRRKPTQSPTADSISTYSPRRSYSNRNNNRAPESLEPTKSPRASSRRGTAKLSTTEGSFTKRETARNRGNSRASNQLKNKENSFSDDDVDESDNYPEPFKSLIQKKKKLAENNVGVSSSNVSVISTHHEERFATPRSEKVTTIPSPTISTTTIRSSSSIVQKQNDVQSSSNRQRNRQVVKSTPSSTTSVPRGNIIDNELEYQITTSRPSSTPRSHNKSRRPNTNKSSNGDTNSNIPVVPQNHRFGKITLPEQKVKTKNNNLAYKQQSNTIIDINDLAEGPIKTQISNSRLPHVVDDNIIPVLVSKTNTQNKYKTTAPASDTFQISPTPRILYKSEITTQHTLPRKSNAAQLKTRNISSSNQSKKIVQNVAVVPPSVGNKKKLYSSRNNYNYTTDVPQSLAKPTPHKFSARYRTELLRNGNLRPSNTPVYTPTVPVISSTTSRQIKNDITHSSIHENELDILTVIPPVSRKLYSASLISESLLNKTSSTEKITIITPESTVFPESTIKLSTNQPSVTTTTEQITTTTTTENYPSTTRKNIPTSTLTYTTTTTNFPTTTTNFPTTTTTNFPTTTTQISIKPDKRTIPSDPPFTSFNRITTPEITTYQYSKTERPVTTTFKVTPQVTKTTPKIIRTSPTITTNRPTVPVTTTYKSNVNNNITPKLITTYAPPTERLISSTKASKKKTAVRMTSPQTEKPQMSTTSRKYTVISTTTKRPQTTTTVKNPQTNQISNADFGPSSFLTSLLSNLFNNPTISTKLPETTRSYSTVSVKPQKIVSTTPTLVSTKQNTKRQNVNNTNNTKAKSKSNTAHSSTTLKSVQSTVKTQNVRNVENTTKKAQKVQNTTTRKPSSTTTPKKQTVNTAKTTQTTRKTTQKTTQKTTTLKSPVTTLNNQIDDFSDIFDEPPRSGLFPNLRTSIISAISSLLSSNTTKPAPSFSNISLLPPPTNITTTTTPANRVIPTEQLTTTKKVPTTTPINPSVDLINTNTISHSKDIPFEQLVATAKNSINTIVDNNFITTSSSPPRVQTSPTTTTTISSTSSTFYTTAIPPYLSTTQLMTPSSKSVPFPTAWAPPDYVPRFAQRPSIAPLGTQSSTTSKPDFVVFGILPNNTVVRKKPRANTTPSPFIVFGIFPNNTIVRKFPNGTILPDDSSDVEVTNLSATNLKYSLQNGITITTSSTTTTTTTTPATTTANNAITQSLPGDSIQDNLVDTVRKVGPTSYIRPEIPASTHILSLTTTKAPKMPSSTSTTTVPPFIPLDPKLPTLAEILGPRVVNAYKEITKETRANRTAKYESSLSNAEVNSLNNQFGTQQIKGSLLDTMSPIIQQPVQSLPVSAIPVSQFRNTESFEEIFSKDVRSTNAQSKPNTQSTESNISSERTKLYLVNSTTPKPTRTKTRGPTTVRATASPTTRRTTTTQRKPAKLPTVTTTTTTEPSVRPTTPSIADLIALTNGKVLTTKMTQLPIIQQTPADELAFLNSLREASRVITQKPKQEQQELANRIVALAVQKAGTKSSTTTPKSPPTTVTSNKSKKELDNNELLEYLQKAGLSPASKATTYGKSNEAILAALLKERGIGPSTSQDTEELLQQLQLAALLDQIVVTPKPKTTRRTTPRPRPTTTTQRPLAGIFQGVRNWLAGAFIGPEQLSQQSVRPTPALAALVVRSRPSSRTKTTTPPPFDDDIEDELFFNEPVKFKSTTTTVKNLQTNTLPNLIIENGRESLTQIKERPRSLQSNTKLEEIEQTTKYRTRSKTSTTRRKPVTITTTTTTTADPFEVDEFEPEDEPPQRVRGQLVDAAINVTKAFSKFLGAAIQGAASTFQNIFNSGARSVGNYFGSASVG